MTLSVRLGCSFVVCDHGRYVVVVVNWGTRYVAILLSCHLDGFPAWLTVAGWVVWWVVWCNIELFGSCKVLVVFASSFVVGCLVEHCLWEQGSHCGRKVELVEVEAGY